MPARSFVRFCDIALTYDAGKVLLDIRSTGNGLARLFAKKSLPDSYALP